MRVNIMAINNIFLVIFHLIVIQPFFTKTTFIQPNDIKKYQKIFKLLTPYKVDDLNKIRFGNQFGDGGYIVPKELISKIERCYTYGVGADISFETYLTSFNKNIIVKMFDHTVNYPKQINSNIYFKKEGLSFKKMPDLNTLSAHLFENNDLEKKILLKIDIEGAEWDILDELNVKILQKAVIFIVELHWFHQVQNLDKFTKVLQKLNKFFTIYHLHGNNCATLLEINGKKLPDVLEVTYINNSYIFKKAPFLDPLPTPLDAGNCDPNDHMLKFWL